MSQNVDTQAQQESLFNLTKQVHSESLQNITRTLEEYGKETGQPATNAAQFASIDGMMAAAGQLVGVTVVGTSETSELPTSEIVRGAVGAMFMFQKTIQNVFTDVLKQANLEGVDVDEMFAEYEKDYQATIKASAAASSA